MSVRAASVVFLAVALSGCSVFRGSPVPPPPPPPQAHPDDARVERAEDGTLSVPASLAQARAAVAAARADESVAEYAPQPLARAETALTEAETVWDSISGASPQAALLTDVAHHSHRARRWAQIAQAQAGRGRQSHEMTRVRRRIARVEAEDERWLGVELVPGRFGDIRFAAGTAQLTPDSRRVIDQMVEFLHVFPRYALEVSGHTDDTPPSDRSLKRFLIRNPDIAERLGGQEERVAAYNRHMSLQRAQAVVQALLAAGVDRNRLTARGYGAGRPVADNDTAAGRRANRRVEVSVIPGPDWAGS